MSDSPSISFNSHLMNMQSFEKKNKNKKTAIFRSQTPLKILLKLRLEFRSSFRENKSQSLEKKFENYLSHSFLGYSPLKAIFNNLGTHIILHLSIPSQQISENSHMKCIQSFENLSKLPRLELRKYSFDFLFFKLFFKS